MVLHLLGKKGWNVYNIANVERVRRDEAEAKAREEAEEQRMQEEDAARRTAILRGEAPPSAFAESAADGSDAVDAGKARRSRDADGVPRERKRRMLRGEDDTDRDIRFAREDADVGGRAKKTLSNGAENDAPLLDHAGHLQLIPTPDVKAIRKAEKNAEAESEKAKKRKREEDQYMMRFSNAAGFKNGMERPWYASNKLPSSMENKATAVVLAEAQEKDVWGNADPLRKDRERNRISSSDPFAAMQHAQRQLKQSERDKEKWQKERMAELEQSKRVQETKNRREKRRKRRNEDEDSLDGFGLDATEARRERSEPGRRRKHSHHQRPSRSHSRERRDHHGYHSRRV